MRPFPLQARQSLSALRHDDFRARASFSCEGSLLGGLARVPIIFPLYSGATEDQQQPITPHHTNMAKKTETPLDDGLQSETAPPSFNWPESTQKKHLRCELNNIDRLAYCDESAVLVEQIEQLEDQKKASASQYKSYIEEKAARLSRVSSYVRNGWEEREVSCYWIYECSGLESDGTPIYHPEKKTLVRDDTGEAVEIREITQEERQLALPLEGEPAPLELVESVNDGKDPA